MVFHSQRERRLWLAAGLCLLLVYLSAFVARPVANQLRDRNLLGVTVLAIFLLALGVVVTGLLRARPGWRVWLAGAVAALGCLALFVLVPMLPEEKLHFLEYGLIGALVYLALLERRQRGPSHEDRNRRRKRLPPAAVAVILTGLAGWLDEGIQAVLPDRYYDLRDVAFNTIAALLVVVSLRVVGALRPNE